MSVFVPSYKHMDGTRPVAADAVAHWGGHSDLTAQQDQRHGRIVTGGQQAEEAPDGRLVIAASVLLMRTARSTPDEA
jgi:hypothetical protein